MIDQSEVIMNTRSFTRSNGTLMARLYERLTKASRRREPADHGDYRHSAQIEYAYRKGVYDAYKAMQEELVR